MLSLSTVSAEMAESYFQNDDYYSSEKGPGEPEFFGKGVDELNLTRTFSREAFRNLLHGYSHDGGDQLVQSSNRKLKDKELAEAHEKFEKRAHVLQAPPTVTDAIRSRVIDKAKENNRHFSWPESKALYAEIGKILECAPVDAKQRMGLKKASVQLIKGLSKADHRAGLDCTFSAPKSVSLACLVRGDSELLKAHKVAVDEALKFIEDKLAGCRVGSSDNRRFMTTGNVMGAKFLHGTSREGDPQLHTHCVLMNMTKIDRLHWRATHNDPIYEHSKLAGLVYQNKLAQQVQKLGYDIETKTTGTFELKGYSEGQLSVFSKRRQQVLENSARLIFADRQRNNLLRPGDTFEKLKPELTKLANQHLNRTSVKIDRRVKTEIKAQNLKARWEKEVQEHGIIHPVRIPKSSKLGAPIDTKFAEEHLGERKAVNKKRDLAVESLTKNLGRASNAKIVEATLESPTISLSKRRSGWRVSHEHIQAEQEILSLARHGRNKFKAFNFRRSLNALAAEKSFTDDQKNALAATINSTDQVMIWNGVAGAGKTWALKEVNALAQKNRYKVVALAPDASAATVLGNELGAISRTVHSYLAKPINKGPTLLIIDEAGKISTKMMQELLKKVEGTKTRIILSGDHRQLGAVEAGNPYAALLKSGVRGPEFTESVRPKTEEMKAVVKAISTQKPEEIKAAIDRLEKNIVERKSLSARINAVLKSYEGTPPEQRKSLLILADTNQERRDLTIQLREKKKSLGELSSIETELKILVPKDLTDAQSKHAEYFKKGDIVISNIRSSVLPRGPLFTVEAIDKNRLILRNGERLLSVFPKMEKLSAYQLETIKIAEGDKLEWRRNHESRTNRDEVTVKSIKDGYAILQNTAKESIRISLNKPQFIDYAHVTTTYSSQGKTADRVIALTESSLSRESFYVMASRARYGIDIVTDNKDKLIQRATKSSAKENALDHIDFPVFNISKSPAPQPGMEREM